MVADPKAEDCSPPRTKPLDWARTAGAENLVKAEMDAVVRRRRRQMIAAVAASAVIAVIGLMAWSPKPASEPLTTSLSYTVVSSATRLLLPDGSVVELKGDATITVLFSDKLRCVVLPRGEAHFQVAKNKDRPFIVTARGVEVRAVGTAFSVQLERSSIGVLVTQGTVAIETPAAEAKPIALLDAGHRISVATGRSNPGETQIIPVSASEIAESLAWRVPRLELNSTPLSEVLPTFNEYGSVHLTLADPSLGRLKLSGRLRADNVAVLLKILETSYGLKAENRGGAEIVLSRP
jgi:transmembrane sensor